MMDGNAAFFELATEPLGWAKADDLMLDPVRARSQTIKHGFRTAGA
jgi:hypothetical protein